MKLFNEYINMLKNYANFSDRTTVRGYWMAVLGNIIVSFVIGAIGALLHLDILSSIYSLVVLIPGLAICVRRLRDAGKAWPWIFISLVPLVGWIILIVFMCKASVPDNGTPVV